MKGNGVQDPSEPGSTGASVVITDSKGDAFPLITDASDMYENTLPARVVQITGTDPSIVDGTATDLDGFQPTGKMES